MNLSRGIRLLATLGLLLAICAAALPAAAEENATAVAGGGAGRYIVSLQDGVSVDSVAATLVMGKGGSISERYQYALNGFAAELSADAVAALRQDPRVTSVMPDPVVHATAQTIPTGVRRIFAAESDIAAIDGVDTRVDVDVAVLDTGSGPHSDLNVVGGKDCTGGSSYSDGNGHGTHVAGTIGALDNGFGVVGVAPGARIWSVKVLGSDGTGYGSWIICGIDWVTARASTIEVANMSLGGDGYPDDNNCGKTNGDTIHQAICRSVAAGVVYAVAAGNDGRDAKNTFPASYNEVITVSALDDRDGLPGNDTLASFSNFGADVDVIAPGVNILSTVPGGSYAAWSGTSMATPHVSGAAALYLVAHPSASPAEVRYALRAAGSTSAWTGDRDSYKEPLIDVSAFDTGGGGGGGTAHDAQVVSVSAPSSVTRGTSATITAQVRNNGSASESISVAMSESPGGAGQTKSVTVASGATSSVSFTWSTSSATSLGTHTFRVTATVAGDTNAANNSASATTSVVIAGGGGGSSMSVSALTIAKTKLSTSYRLSTRVTVKSNGAVVRSARVTIRLTYPNGSTYTLSGYTNTAGIATIYRSVTLKGTYRVVVSGISKSGYTYNAAGNAVSNAAITIT